MEVFYGYEKNKINITYFGGIISFYNFIYIIISFFIKDPEIKNINAQKLNLKIEKKETFCLYIGRPTCPDCEFFFPMLKKETGKKYDVFYLNTDENREASEYGDLMKKLNVDSVPLLIHIKKGEVTDRLEFTEDSKEILKFLNKEAY